MAIREDLVVSAAQFLQDPSVASSSLENRIAFLRTKNLTQEEIDAALSRTGAYPGQPPNAAVAAPSSAVAPQQAYYQPYPPQYAWQPPPPPPPVPRRDWRDWFIMATVVGGASYGLYTLTKRYVMPLIAPPTPERLEQDKRTIEEQFEKAFGLVEQLARDTEELKAAERTRTERLDSALSELETVMNDLKSANRRREDEAQRIRDDVRSLKDSIPAAMTAHRETTDNRLREVNAELTSLKTLLTQRMNASQSASTTSSNSGSYLQSVARNGASAAAPGSAAASHESQSGDGANAGAAGVSSAEGDAAKKAGASALGRNSPLAGGGKSGSAKASIPAWQMAMAGSGAGSSSGVNGGADSAGSSQPSA